MANYKVGEFAEKIGVSVSTLQRWDRTNVLKSRRTPTNQRYYTDEDLNRVLNLEQETKSKRKNVGYCRVLTQGQKQNLENQKEFVSVYSLSHGVILDEIYTDIIISNPPYMDDNGKKINENEHKAISRHEIKLSLSELISNAKRLLKPIGLLFFIHRTHRLVEIIKALDKNNFSMKKMIFIYSARNNKSTMVFVEAIKGKKVKLEIQNYYIYH